MRIWIAVVVLVGLGACGGSDGDLLHRHCTVTTATSDEAITFSVCGSERAEADWKDKCGVHAREFWSDGEPICFCEDAPGLCDEPGTREIGRVCLDSDDIALCAGACVYLEDDSAHCGACGNACPENHRCNGAECEPCNGDPYDWASNPDGCW